MLFDADGSETGFTVASSAIKVSGMFGSVKNTDGTMTLYSVAAGELPGTYLDCKQHGGSACVISVKDTEGRIGGIGLYGETVIPFTDEISYCSELDISYDGTTALLGKTTLYRIDYDMEAAKAAAGGKQTEAAETEKPADIRKGISDILQMFGKPAEKEPETAEDGWTCPTCGKLNPADANFCPNDATKRPAAEWTCPTCGKLNPADANFCSNDATPRP